MDELVLLWISLLFPALALVLLFLNKTRANQLPYPAEVRGLPGERGYAASAARTLSRQRGGGGGSSRARRFSSSETQGPARRAPHFPEEGGSSSSDLAQQDAGGGGSQRHPRPPPPSDLDHAGHSRLSGAGLLSQAALALQSYAEEQQGDQRRVSGLSSLTDFTASDYVDSEYEYSASASAHQQAAPGGGQTLGGGGAPQQRVQATAGVGAGRQRRLSATVAPSPEALSDFQQWWVSQQQAEEEGQLWQPDQQLAALRAASSQAGASVPTVPRVGIRQHQRQQRQHPQLSSTSSTSGSGSGAGLEALEGGPAGPEVYHQQQHAAGYVHHAGSPLASSRAFEAGTPAQEPPPGRLAGARKTVPGWEQRTVGQAARRVVRRNLAGGRAELGSAGHLNSAETRSHWNARAFALAGMRGRAWF
jgi:hypothetical protein